MYHLDSRELLFLSSLFSDFIATPTPAGCCSAADSWFFGATRLTKRSGARRDLPPPLSFPPPHTAILTVHSPLSLFRSLIPFLSRCPSLTAGSDPTLRGPRYVRANVQITSTRDYNDAGVVVETDPCGLTAANVSGGVHLGRILKLNCYARYNSRAVRNSNLFGGRDLSRIISKRR